jgi:hypothetical protein
MSQDPPVRAAQVFLISLVVAIPDFALVKALGWDERSWPAVLTAAFITATLIGMCSLVANSRKATSR